VITAGMLSKIQITDKTNKRTWAIIDGANSIDVTSDLYTAKSNSLMLYDLLLKM